MYKTSRHVEYSTAMANKRASHTAAFNLKVIETAEKCWNRAAVREYSVNEKLVRDWRKKAELEALPRGKRSLTILSWYIHHRYYTHTHNWWARIRPQ